MSSSSDIPARQRALCTLGAMGAGIVLGNHIAAFGSLFWFSLGCGLVALSIALTGRTRSWVMVLCVIAIASGWGQFRTRESPTNRLDQIVGEVVNADNMQSERVPIEIAGTLIAPVRTQVFPKKPGDPPTWSATKTSTEMRVHQVYMSDTSGRGTWIDASGIVRVLLPNPIANSMPLRAGDRVEVIGLFEPVGTARNLGDLDWGALAKQSGRVGTLIIHDKSMIRIRSNTGIFDRLSSWFVRGRAAAQIRAMQAIGLDASTPDDHASNSSSRAMLAALLLGQRDPAFGEVYESFQRVGVAHVLAISGFHLALVIMLGVICIRLLGEYPKAELAIVIAILIAGLLVVPMRPPIVRAGVIVIAFMVASRVGRRYDQLTILVWVGVGLLIWRPMDVYSLGYQLSMGITGLLVVLSNKDLHATLNRSSFSVAKGKRGTTPRSFAGKAARSVWSTAKVNIVCWAVAIPGIMFHAGILSLWAPAVSLVLIPMVILLMVIGYIQIAIGIVSPTFALDTIGIVEWVANGVNSFVGMIDTLPGSSVRVLAINPMWTLAATACIAAVATGWWKIRQRRVLIVGGILVLWIIAAPALMRERAALRIDMLDVGDGSCLIIQSDGEGLIWDCGSLNRRVGKVAARASRKIGLNQIHDAIVTHDNLDHFNGLIDAAPILGIRRIWVSQRMLDDPSSAWVIIERRLEEMGIEIREIGIGDTIVVGDVELECLWPNPEEIEDFSDNNTSVVVRIKVPVNYNDIRTVLLTGDIEHEAMNAIAHAYPDLRADIIELPHHGSSKPGSFEFVQSLDPSVILQSTGPSRLNDPRWDGVRDGRTWLSTAQHGGLWVRIDQSGSITSGWVID